MRTTILAFWVLLAAGLACAAPPRTPPEPVVERAEAPEQLGSNLGFDRDYWQSTVHMVRSSWAKFLAQKIRPGMSLAKLDALMKPNCRDRAVTHYGEEGDFTVYYLVDDFFQVTVDLTAASGVRQAQLQPRPLWLRYPSPGGVTLVPPDLRDEIDRAGMLVPEP
jgi:hypothetical protein